MPMQTWNKALLYLKPVWRIQNDLRRTRIPLLILMWIRIRILLTEIHCTIQLFKFIWKKLRILRKQNKADPSEPNVQNLFKLVRIQTQ